MVAWEFEYQAHVKIMARSPGYNKVITESCHNPYLIKMRKGVCIVVASIRSIHKL